MDSSELYSNPNEEIVRLMIKLFTPIIIELETKFHRACSNSRLFPKEQITLKMLKDTDSMWPIIKRNADKLFTTD